MTETQIDDARSARARTDPRVWCAALAVAGCVYIAARLLGDVVHLFHPLPFWDYWDFVGVLPRYLSGEYSLTDLWIQHSEHRILFPRLVFIADAVWFGGNGVFCVVVSCLLQGVHAALLGWLVASSTPGPRAVRILAAAAVIGCVLYPSQSVNLFWAFQVQFILVYVAITSALWQLVRPRVGPWQLLAAIVSGCIATGSMANGLLVWPLLWSLAITRRLPLRSILVLVAAGAAMIFVYLKGFETFGPSPLRALAEPLQLLHRLCILLGNPLWLLGFGPAFVCGAVTLVLAVWSVLRRVRCWRRSTATEALLAHLVLLLLATASLIAAGRIALPIEEMLNSRYGTPVLLLWAALLGLGFGGNGARRWWMIGTATALVIGLTLLARSYRILLEPIHHIQSLTTACLLSGVTDTDFLHQTHDVPGDWTLNSANVLRTRRLSVFGTGLQYLMGANLLEHFSVESAVLAVGANSGLQPVAGHPGASWIDGSACHARTRLPAELILVVDENWRIVGLGMSSRAPGEQQDQGDGPPRRWRAWVREADHPGRELSIYGIWDGVAVPLATLPGQVGAAHAGSLIDDFALAGPAVTLTSLEVTGSWSPRGWYAGTPEPPYESLALGSWSGDDAGMGRVRASFAARRDDAVLLVPLLAGPDTSGMMLRIVDGWSGKVQASLSAKPSPDGWHLWRVPLPARDAGERWVLEARDRGRGWGQWFAVAAPHWQLESAPR